MLRSSPSPLKCEQPSLLTSSPDDRVHEDPAIYKDISASPLDRALERAENALLSAQNREGFWCFELEADCTITAEYILMMHFMDEIDHDLQTKMACYLRALQGADGGWPLYHGGPADLSCSVKVYYALKCAGDAPDLLHMTRSREVILGLGGAELSNVFTMMALAMFEQAPWRATVFFPVEFVLLPRWFPFHISKVSYWARTVMVPLAILCSIKARARNPEKISVQELFSAPQSKIKNRPVEQGPRPKPKNVSSALNRLLILADRLGHRLEPWIPGALRRHALKKAEGWMLERLNGRGGLGAIFPAMVNAYESLACMGYSKDHPAMINARAALRDLVVEKGDRAYCQPCWSCVWDTALACMTLQELNSVQPSEPDRPAPLPDCPTALAVTKALDWLVKNQLLDKPGDWREDRPNLRGGGWPFQFENDHYPDLDDTAVVACALLQDGRERYRESALRAGEWIAGMQSRNGGFGSFDADNDAYHLNEIPFADHGALLDPPTSDVSARCAWLLALLSGERPEFGRAVDAARKFLDREQEADGAWFGRWGTNYIYGTWSVLSALEKVGVPAEHESVRRGVEWLKSVQRDDGGWGEDNGTYFDASLRGRGERSTSFQTAWALLGLMASGETDSESVRRGVDSLVKTQCADGFWREPDFTSPGFPRVFYLKYHAYDKHFPFWALARYRRSTSL